MEKALEPTRGGIHVAIIVQVKPQAELTGEVPNGQVSNGGVFNAV